MSLKSGLKNMGWVTLVVALLTCATVVVLASQGPKVVTIDEIVDRATYLDPKQGDSFDLGEMQGSLSIVLLLGDCTGCSLMKVDLNDVRKTGGFKVYGVFKPGSEHKDLQALYPWLNMVEDPSGLHSGLNAYWSPRAYAFTASGTLLALQRPEESLKSFVHRAGSML